MFQNIKIGSYVRICVIEKWFTVRVVDIYERDNRRLYDVQNRDGYTVTLDRSTLQAAMFGMRWRGDDQHAQNSAK